MNKVTLPHDEYSIKTSTHVLTKKPGGNADDFERWSLNKRGASSDVVIEYLFLQKITPLYVTFWYFVGDDLQYLKLRPDRLEPVETIILNPEIKRATGPI